MGTKQCIFKNDNRGLNNTSPGNEKKEHFGTIIDFNRKFK